jgi:hypothetical protein
MAGHDGLAIASPLPVPPVSRRVAKTASNTFFQFGSDIGSRSLLTVILTVATSSPRKRLRKGKLDAVSLRDSEAGLTGAIPVD